MRIARTAGREGRPVALLGAFGTGKSSILNVVRAELDSTVPRVIVARVDVWTVPKPEDAPRLALNQIINALDDFVDTIELRGLPLSYKQLAAAEPSGKLTRVLGLNHARDSLEALARLSPILDALNARIVLIVEEVERVGKAFDTRHLARFLWALRSLDRSAFVLAVDPDSVHLDFSKLCDTIERVPAIHVEHVATIFMAAYGHWTSAYSYIDPHQNRREGGKLQLGTARMAYVKLTGRDTPLDTLVSLLQTPRALKHVLRRVDHAWSHLHGEVDLDDVVIISALRHGAPDAYTFLVANIDSARHEPDKLDELLPRTKTVDADWKELVETLANGAAVQRLVDLLGIKQLEKDPIVTSPASPQGVHVQEPVDYFSRIVAEELSPNELRDQDVLQHIERWKSGQREILVDRLVSATGDNRHYGEIWEHFSERHTEADLIALTELVVARLLKEGGSSAAADHPAILALWRRCNRRFQRNQHTEWLADLIVSAVPLSLSLVDGLFYYWTGQYGIVDDAGKVAVRQSISKALRAKIRSADELARTLTKERPYTISSLIMAQNGTQAIKRWRDYFAPLLIDGARFHPDVILPQLANLAGDDKSHTMAAGADPPIFINRYKIDQERLKVLFRDRLDEALGLLAGYSGTDVYALRAKDDASAWLKERST